MIATGALAEMVAPGSDTEPADPSQGYRYDGVVYKTVDAAYPGYYIAQAGATGGKDLFIQISSGEVYTRRTQNICAEKTADGYTYEGVSYTYTDPVYTGYLVAQLNDTDHSYQNTYLIRVEDGAVFTQSATEMENYNDYSSLYWRCIHADIHL